MKEIIENLHSETFKQFNELKHSRHTEELVIDAQNLGKTDKKSVYVDDENIPDSDNDDFIGSESDDNNQSETSSPIFDRDSGFDDKSKQTDTSPDHSNLSTSPRRSLVT